MTDFLQDPDVELPPPAIEHLRTVGVPRELHLAGWLGPLFSSEMAEGKLRQGQHGYLIGSIREADDVYARFWIQRRTGTVFLESGQRLQWVSSDVVCFVSLMTWFSAAWSAMPDLGDDSIDELLPRLVAEIKRVDPPALQDADSYWSGWIEELSEA